MRQLLTADLENLFCRCHDIIPPTLFGMLSHVASQLRISLIQESPDSPSLMFTHFCEALELMVSASIDVSNKWSWFKEGVDQGGPLLCKSLYWVWNSLGLSCMYNGSSLTKFALFLALGISQLNHVSTFSCNCLFHHSIPVSVQSATNRAPRG
jgi:hypothetical protein